MLGASNEAVEFELNVSFELTTVADLDPTLLSGYVRSARALISKIHGANSVVMMSGTNEPVNASDLLKDAHTRYLKNLIVSIEEVRSTMSRRTWNESEADWRRTAARSPRRVASICRRSVQD